MSTARCHADSEAPPLSAEADMPAHRQHCVLLPGLIVLCAGDAIVTQPGSELVLPITQQLTLRPPDCDRYQWGYGGIRGDVIIANNRTCQMTKPNSERFPNMKISENGSLIISPVTAENAGTYTVNLLSAAGKHIHTAIYTVHVEDPVSPPVLDILCLPDGRAQVSCWVHNGSHYTTYLHVTGASEGGHSSPSNNIAVTVLTSGPWSVTCTAENRVSRRNITQSRAACPVSLSGIAVNSSCLPDGSAEAVCWVANGSDPQFSWSLEGKSQPGRSSSLSSRVSLPPPVSGTLRCNVTNTNSVLTDSKNISCPAPVSVPVITPSCLWNGSAEISCEVQNGTDLALTLIINGSSEVSSTTSLQRRVSVTVPSMLSPSNVTCSVMNSISNSSAMKTADACPAPISTPRVTFSCHLNGSATVSCEVEKKQHITYRWSVNKNPLQDYFSDVITLPAKLFTADPPTVRCSVNNSLSDRNSSIARVFCPAPMSAPLVSISCLQNGSAVISCRLLRGTDLHFSLTLNGKSVLANSRSSWMGVNYTEHTKGPWNVSCTAANLVNVTETSHANLACSDSGSSLYAKLLPVRLFLVIILPVFLVCFEVYHHLQEKRSGDFSRGNRNRKPLPAVPRENTE